jgi:hypothetical protein
MNKILNLFSTLCLAFLIFSQTEPAHAIDWNPEGTMNAQPITNQVSLVVGDATSASRKISYGIGGLGAVALGALAFFGRFQWGWFFGLIGGLALIGLYGIAVEQLAGGNITELKSN